MPDDKVQLFTSADGVVSLEVSLDNETTWLSQAQMCALFSRERSVITKHINNVFNEGELDRKSVCAKFAHTAGDGKTYQVDYYNLDVIISVGYRVKSQRGVQFRQWATRVLKQHLVQGYSINQKRLAAMTYQHYKAFIAPDITTWSRGVLALNPKAYALFHDSFAKSGEFLPISINSETHYLNTLYIIPEQAINKENAVEVIDSGVHFGQGNVVFDESFLDSEQVMVFKSNTDRLLHSFCTGKFKKMYEENGFRGLVFEEVEAQ